MNTELIGSNPIQARMLKDFILLMNALVAHNYHCNYLFKYLLLTTFIINFIPSLTHSFHVRISIGCSPYPWIAPCPIIIFLSIIMLKVNKYKNWN